MYELYDKKDGVVLGKTPTAKTDMLALVRKFAPDMKATDDAGLMATILRCNGYTIEKSVK